MAVESFENKHEYMKLATKTSYALLEVLELLLESSHNSLTLNVNNSEVEVESVGRINDVIINGLCTTIHMLMSDLESSTYEVRLGLLQEFDFDINNIAHLMEKK